MKMLVLFLFLLSAVFTGTFVAAKKIGSAPLLQTSVEKASLPIPCSFTLKNHPFAVVIVGVNNGAFVSKTLNSVFSQNYENYRVIYIDDASDDGSYDLASDLIYDSGHLGQVTMTQNQKRLGNLANIFRAVQLLADEEIVVVLDGEDWLAHEWVLQRLNAYYADSDIWLTYGQYRNFPSYQLGDCQQIKDFSFRTQRYTSFHLKTFYAGLFKKVRETDFVFGGDFLFACSEMAYMIPMLEMAGNHIQFISETLYINNSQANRKQDWESQVRCEKFIRALDPYSSLDHLIEVEKCGA